MFGLVHALQNNPDVQTVYVTEDMSGWLFSKNNRHPKEITRKEAVAYCNAHPETMDNVTQEAEGSEDELQLLKEENDNLIAANAELEGQKELLTKAVAEFEALIASNNQANKELSDVIAARDKQIVELLAANAELEGKLSTKKK